VKRISHGGEEHSWHVACAERYLKDLAEKVPLCAHCGRPGGNQASLGEGVIHLHRECEEPYRRTRRG
jgi:hypothetical protein